MDEFVVVIIAGVVFLLSFFGMVFGNDYTSKKQHIQCIQAVHDKPALEINLICK